MLTRFQALFLIVLLLTPSLLAAQPDPGRSYQEAEYLLMWENMSRPPTEWIILKEMVDQAEAEPDPTKRIPLLSAALKRLDEYLASTPAPARVAAEKVEALTQRLNKQQDATLAELRILKEKERQTVDPSSATAPSLLDLWKRITSSNPPIPFTPRELSQLANIPPFLSGPHVTRFDSKYVESFGHYNPAFIEWAKQTLLTQDGASFHITDRIFQEHLSFHVEYLLGARYYLLANPTRFEELSRAYKSALQAKRAFNPLDEIVYQDGSYDGQYLAYWLRREIDGTAPAVQELLELVLDSYRPDILLSLSRTHRRSPNYSLTIPGTYHSDEVEFNDGQQVFTLQLGDDTPSILKPDVIKIELTHDAIMDADGAASGKSVSLASKTAENILILRGSFTPGAVTTAKIPPLRECSNGCQIKLPGNSYTLTIAHIEERMPETLNDDPEPGYLIEINDGRKTKLLRNVKKIVWAGDLDRDGKLDIIYDDAFHYNVATSLHLLLSSASRHALLKEVSHCLSVGC